MHDINCHCGTEKLFSDCCEPFITGKKMAPEAEALMRSRYSAYVIHNADYLWKTTAAKTRKYHSKSAILQWARANHWLKLEVMNATKTTVEFKAYYLDANLQAQVHHEKSSFVNIDGKWYYLDGEY